MKRVLVIGTTDLSKDPRPLRQIKYLSKFYQLDSIGEFASGFESSFYKIKRSSLWLKLFSLILLQLRLYKYYFKIDFRLPLSKKQLSLYDLIIIHHVRLAPIVFDLKSKNTKVVIDAHEYYPENFTNNILWRLTYKKSFVWLCSKYMPLMCHIFTVGKNISELYETNYNPNVSIIKSCPDYASIKPIINSNGKIKIVHHGFASSTRQLELLIELMTLIDKDKFELHFYLVHNRNTQCYLVKLKEKAINFENIVFHNPVPFNQIIPTINKMDINLVYFPPDNVNLRYVLPNKFFEGIQARLMTVTGPSVEMMSEIDKYGIGLYSEEFTLNSLSKLINNINLDLIKDYKINADRIAHIFSSEYELKNMHKTIHKILNI